jgi:proteasome lid subunit RPN8/RPN11
MLKMGTSAVEEMIRHAREHAPIEARGYLAEKDDAVERGFPLAFFVRLAQAEASANCPILLC